MSKKQIVFIGHKPSAAIIKIVRALKSLNKYEIILICFSKVDNKFVKDSCDKLLTFDLNITPSPKNFFQFLKKLRKKETHSFFKEIKSLDPYFIQMHSSNLISFFSFLFIKKRPKVFFLYDIWQYYEKKLTLKKGSGRMQYINTMIEKFCMKKSDGIINKSGENSLKYVRLKYGAPIIDFLPYCLDDWIILPEKKSTEKNKEIHIVYSGTLWDKWEGHASFYDMINKIISQNIHLHFYPSTLNGDTDKLLKNFEKDSEYFHLYPLQNAEKIQESNKEMAKSDYAIHLDFYDNSIKKRFIENSMSAKIFGYVEAGLPVLINRQFKNMCNILESNKMGIGITYKDLGNLREVIKKFEYPTLEEIKDAQEKFKISNNIHRLERFYEEVHQRSKK